MVYEVAWSKSQRANQLAIWLSTKSGWLATQAGLRRSWQRRGGFRHVARQSADESAQAAQVAADRPRLRLVLEKVAAWCAPRAGQSATRHLCGIVTSDLSQQYWRHSRVLFSLLMGSPIIGPPKTRKKPPKTGVPPDTIGASSTTPSTGLFRHLSCAGLCNRRAQPMAGTEKRTSKFGHHVRNFGHTDVPYRRSFDHDWFNSACVGNN